VPVITWLLTREGMLSVTLSPVDATTWTVSGKERGKVTVGPAVKKLSAVLSSALNTPFCRINRAWTGYRVFLA